MPQRSNDFQELVAMLTKVVHQHDAVSIIESRMIPDRVPGGDDREVDVAAETQVVGKQVYIGVECRAWKRPQTVEWVEAMHGKHDHLMTSELILVSESGFTKGALRLADFYGITAVTPGEVTPGFVGRIVNNLDSLWAKEVAYKNVHSMTLWVWPDGASESAPVAVGAESLIVKSDGTPICTALDFFQQCVVKGMPPDSPAIRDATGDEKAFEIGFGDPAVNASPVSFEGGPMCLEGTLEDASKIYAPIVAGQVVGEIEVNVCEIELEHGSYRGTDYSVGEAALGDRDLRVVVTESTDGIGRTIMRGRARKNLPTDDLSTGDKVEA